MSAEIIEKRKLEFDMECLYPADDFCFRMEALRLLNPFDLTFQQYAITAVNWASEKSKDTMIGFFERDDGLICPIAFQFDFDEIENLPQRTDN